MITISHSTFYIFSSKSKLSRIFPRISSFFDIFFQILRNFLKVSECIQMHPNASERIRTGPNTSEKLEKLAKTSKNVRKMFAKIVAKSFYVIFSASKRRTGLKLCQSRDLDVPDLIFDADRALATKKLRTHQNNCENFANIFTNDVTTFSPPHGGLLNSP